MTQCQHQGGNWMSHLHERHTFQQMAVPEH
jgi:hypothetical protein